MYEELKTLASLATRIHVVTHHNPDYDAYASLTFMYALLKKNFNDKIITMSLEADLPNEIMSYLPYYDEISYMPIDKALEELSPELLIIVDAPSVERISKNPTKVKELLVNCKTAIFDHHEIEETEVNLLVNRFMYAAVEVIYSYAKTHALELPDKWEEFYITGFVGDSYRFYYQYPCYRESFEVISLILDKGYTIRDYSDRLYGYSKKDFVVFKLLLNHLKFEQDYSFSYITWDEFNHDILNKLTSSEYKKARRFFIDEMMAKTYSTDFAVFIVPDDTYNDGKTYSGSIRAKEGTIDCTVIAKQLGGGGHTTGSGFIVVADSIDEAIIITTNVLHSHLQKARDAITQRKK